jgi:hypothetical protein
MNVRVDLPEQKNRTSPISSSDDIEFLAPLAVTDPHIRKELQLAGLRFMCTRARWLESEATIIGKALKAGTMTSDQVDAKLEEMGALDVVYPELMGCAE